MMFTIPSQIKFALFAGLLVFSACAESTEKSVTPATSSSGGEVQADEEVIPNTVMFGVGGDPYGDIVEYHLHDDGHVTVYHASTEETEDHADWDLEETKALFAEVEALNLPEIAEDKGGEVVFFLGYDIDGERVVFKWGATGYYPPSSVSDLYNKLIAKAENMAIDEQ